ncbi:MAG: hypothetical protein BGO25_00465 [Acidobacteriales bacterium 59-55]|nr:hypothetical protein [Terriglobales bacterium]OJV39747.1 MAG: hypothetical protein BGO25_00465 [Acidobacteriales bacterium 59-55]
MNFRYLALAVGLALTTLAAHAQVGLYINPVAIRISNSQADTGPFAFLGENSKSNIFYGVNIGGYYNFYHQGKTEVGLDIRDSFTNGNSATLNSFLVGVRVATAPFKRPLKPYLQASVGVGTTRPPTSSVRSNRAQFGIFGGADYTLSRHVDFRVVEIGFNSLTTASSSTIGGVGSIPASKLLSFSTGLVFRFP